MPGAAVCQNIGNCRERQDVADDCRFAIESGLCWIGRLRQHHTTAALQRFQQGCFFAADIGAGADHYLKIERIVVAIQQVRLARLLDRKPHGPRRRRIFVPAIDIATSRPDRTRTDHHAFNQSEGIALHDHPIAIGAGVPFVGIRHHILLLRPGLLRNLPLLPHRERRTPAAP